MSQKTIVVHTEDLGDVTVKKLALGNYAELLKALKDLPGEIGKMVRGKSVDDLKSMGVEDLLQWLPALMQTVPGEVIHVLVMSTDKTQEEIEGITELSDVVALFEAVLQLNDYKKAIEAAKKLVANRSKSAAPEAAQQPALQ